MQTKRKASTAVYFDMMQVVMFWLGTDYVFHADKLARVYYHFVVMFVYFCGNHSANIFHLENYSILMD